ncbi:uncharacterized protein LOC126827715 [Patella vulgata]|uniref:uncharacterized protein LOC126827715 n=1 Tax=Patella vulgata TaxID=6465 RepID=UPI0024A8B9C6|nr:uncharacterized protein LOC126827715 [Patella vulgata]
MTTEQSIKKRRTIEDLETEIKAPWEQGGFDARPAPEEQRCSRTRPCDSLDSKSWNKSNDHINEGSGAHCRQETSQENSGPGLLLPNSLPQVQKEIVFEPDVPNEEVILKHEKYIKHEHEKYIQKILFDDNIVVEPKRLIFIKIVTEKIFKDRKDVNPEFFILNDGGLRDSKGKELILNDYYKYNIIFISNVHADSAINHMMLLYTKNSDHTAGIIETDQEENSASAIDLLEKITFPDCFTIIPGGIKNRATFGFQQQLDSCWVWVIKFAEYIVFGQKSEEEAPSVRYEKIYEENKKAIQCTES